MVKDIKPCKFWHMARAITKEKLQFFLNGLRKCEYWKGRCLSMVNRFKKPMVASNWNNLGVILDYLDVILNRLVVFLALMVYICAGS